MYHVIQSTGPFRKWPFFKPTEIETIAGDDLRTHRLMPERPREVDVDSLVQALFGFAPTYTDPGEGILGYIRFDTRKPAVIILHESLGDLEAEGPTTEHRRRSTLAHEIGHGRLHVGPFTELMQARRAGHGTELVRDPKAPNHFLCRASDVRDTETTKPAGLLTWERMAEWQANRYMAAVLVPARLLRLTVGEELGVADAHTLITLDETRRARLAPLVAARFNVSRQLAACRLAELFPVAAQGDLFAA